MSLHLQVMHFAGTLGCLLCPEALLPLFYASSHTHTFSQWSLANPDAWASPCPYFRFHRLYLFFNSTENDSWVFFLNYSPCCSCLISKSKSKRGCFAQTISFCKSGMPVLLAHHNISNQSSLKPQPPMSRTARRNSCPSP